MIIEDIIIEDAIHIEMSLESGDVGIENTLYDYFKNEFNYIENLEKYLKQWVWNIKVNMVQLESPFSKKEYKRFIKQKQLIKKDSNILTDSNLNLIFQHIS